eukprot:366093-Chlamydomonas_euryale.AAC.11
MGLHGSCMGAKWVCMGAAWELQGSPRVCMGAAWELQGSPCVCMGAACAGIRRANSRAPMSSASWKRTPLEGAMPRVRASPRMSPSSIQHDDMAVSCDLSSFALHASPNSRTRPKFCLAQTAQRSMHASHVSLCRNIAAPQSG